RAVKYGVTRDYVRELNIVTGDGKLVTVGSRTIKNSSGLDLKNLIIGSEGTLGVITKIVLKIIPKPQKCIS
ncbi:FAD/FMN-containing dehydrogenase, partial [human gut metagenome]